MSRGKLGRKRASKVAVVRPVWVFLRAPGSWVYVSRRAGSPGPWERRHPCRRFLLFEPKDAAGKDTDAGGMPALPGTRLHKSVRNQIWPLTGAGGSEVRFSMMRPPVGFICAPAGSAPAALLCG